MPPITNPLSIEDPLDWMARLKEWAKKHPQRKNLSEAWPEEEHMPRNGIHTLGELLSDLQCILKNTGDCSLPIETSLNGLQLKEVYVSATQDGKTKLVLSLDDTTQGDPR